MVIQRIWMDSIPIIFHGRRSVVVDVKVRIQ
jgi:hypothetical protein